MVVGISEFISEFPLQSTKSFNDRLERLFSATGSKTDSDLAKALDIKPQSVGAARKREQIPSGWVEKVAVDFSVCTDWLFFGEGPMLREQCTQSAQLPSPDADAGQCPRCAKLEKELEDLRQEQRKERSKNDDLIQALLKERDRNEEVNATVLRLTQENAELRIQLARAAPDSAEATRRSA